MKHDLGGVRIVTGDVHKPLYFLPATQVAQKSLFQQPRAFPQFRQVQLGYEPISHTGFVPVDEVVSLTREFFLSSGRGVVRRPDKQINETLPDRCRLIVGIRVLQVVSYRRVSKWIPFGSDSGAFPVPCHASTGGNKSALAQPLGRCRM
jgi:hypothetical protein